MRFAYATVGLALVVTACAEQPQRCGNGRTVDDYLADIAKSQKKQKRERNKNPLPDSVCIFGWCREAATRPPTGPFPEPSRVERTKAEPKVQPAKAEQQPPTPPPGESSSKRPLEEVAAPPKVEETDDPCDPMRAAHDVEVGDWHFEDKNYRGAVGRYKAALESWPSEPNVLFRLARTYERMKDTDHALEYYKLVVDADPDAPIAKEAQAALARLKKATATSPDGK
jgi:tetratricopeptide (TPR) repeat protein